MRIKNRTYCVDIETRHGSRYGTRWSRYYPRGWAVERHLLPAWMAEDGTKHWARDGKFHREDDLPAYVDGQEKIWFKEDGQTHKHLEPNLDNHRSAQ